MSQFGRNSNHVQTQYRSVCRSGYKKKVIESGTKSIVSISTFGDSWPVTLFERYGKTRGCS